MTKFIFGRETTSACWIASTGRVLNRNGLHR